jgi:hypothetical protein
MHIPVTLLCADCCCRTPVRLDGKFKKVRFSPPEFKVKYYSDPKYKGIPDNTLDVSGQTIASDLASYSYSPSLALIGPHANEESPQTLQATGPMARCFNSGNV